MKKTLDAFYDKLSHLSESEKTEVELVCDEAGQTIRGGDKDYAPTYGDELEREGKLHWFFPSILLNI